MLCAYSIGAPILKPEMWADTHWKTIIALFLMLIPVKIQQIKFSILGRKGQLILYGHWAKKDKYHTVIII